MIKLALVGKNISHSKSPKVYSDLLGYSVDYSLLDFDSESKIPNINDLMNVYSGISITSPYKEFFLDQVELTGEAIHLNAINCIRKRNDIIEACNTDFLAIEVIIKKHKTLCDEVVVLGDGVMARVLTHSLHRNNVSFIQLSRKKNTDFYDLNIADHFGRNKKVLIINTCSREYVYSGEVETNYIFWDFNYDFEPHRSKFSQKCIYMDGIEMLILQAKFALEFWSIKK